ncbi:PHAX protein, partial [Polypterus senegalus]
MDSSDNSDTDSDEEKVLWKRKRQKCSNTPAQPVAFALPPATQKSPGHKVNNIWGAVVQEQNQEAVAAELDFLGMEGEISMSCRQSETYNYVLARKLMEKERLEQAGEEMAKLDEELEEYMQDGKTDGKTEQENGTGHLKRKRPIKDRLGKIQEMDYKGRCEITEDDDEEKVIDEITYRLREPKKELIERVVKTIGKKKAIELLMETTEIEQNGGIYTLEIFIDETQKEYANKKAAKKRRRQVLGKKMKQAIKTLNLQEHDDASRETFASDTNEALASLEDSHEGHTETAIDTEDAVDIMLLLLKFLMDHMMPACFGSIERGCAIQNLEQLC